MCRIKSIIAFAISICLLGAHFSVSATAFSDDKILFAANMQEQSVKSQCTTMDSEYNVCEVMKKYVANDIDGALEIINAFNNSSEQANAYATEGSYEVIEKYLNANNMYIYSFATSDAPSANTRSVGSQDVQLNRVMVSYSTTMDAWIVTGGGYWRTEKYKSDAPLPSGTTPLSVGGCDAVGFSLMNTYGVTPTLLSASGYVHDGHGHSMTLTNPTNGNSKNGLIFQYQDSVSKANGSNEILYMGYGFSAQGKYSSNFSQYHGRARTHYAHTWKECGIDSIGVGVDGFSITFSTENNKWVISNNSDTVF